MSHTPHALAEEFPELAQKIAALKDSDAHFAKLVESYNDINHKVYRAENRLDLLTEAQEEALKRERAQLKDHIWSQAK
jgi:uncharacterized protein